MSSCEVPLIPNTDSSPFVGANAPAGGGAAAISSARAAHAIRAARARQCAVPELFDLGRRRDMTHLVGAGAADAACYRCSVVDAVRDAERVIAER
jgi:hypothetical protein